MFYTSTFHSKHKMETKESLNMRSDDLSNESREFIAKFRNVSQEKYDKVAKEVTDKGVVPISKVNWMVI